MEKLYAQLVKKGSRTIDQVPIEFQAKVKELLDGETGVSSSTDVTALENRVAETEKVLDALLGVQNG